MEKVFMRIYALFFVFLLILPLKSEAAATIEYPQPPQDKGAIFETPRPFANDKFSSTNYYNSWGADLALSSHGFGFGFTLDWTLSGNTHIMTGLLMSGAKNTDEFESWDGYDYRVPNKINRLYLFPINVGVKQYILGSILGESFRPNISVGLAPSFIVATPYAREFFNALHYADGYFRLGGFVGVGSDFGAGKALISVNARYYYIPFGGKGLESVKNHPLKDFGGLFLDLTLGMRY
jgi:hypothetical protein